LGGRNQHLALLCAKALRDKQGITILCAGTDGTDGPTDAAGAVVDSETMSKSVDAEVYLSEFDSYNFFKRSSGHIITGPTLTNVMDIAIIIVSL
jgi:glycerate-2-kinase